MQWYTKAADQGLDVAQLNIGNLYEHGYGVPQDYDKAFGWYKRPLTKATKKQAIESVDWL